MVIRCILLILLLQLSACSWFGHKGDCSGEDCDDTPKLLEQKAAPHKWYCYGQAAGTWDCVDKPDQTKIVSINPEPTAPMSESQVPGESTAQPVIRPLLDITRTIEDEADDHYTVQLTAAHSEKELADYAQAHGVEDPLFVVIPGDEGPTYILVLGIYEDQDKALDAKSVWARGRLLDVEPWVRKIGPIKAAIKAKEKNS